MIIPKYRSISWSSAYLLILSISAFSFFSLTYSFASSFELENQSVGIIVEYRDLQAREAFTFRNVFSQFGTRVTYRSPHSPIDRIDYIESSKNENTNDLLQLCEAFINFPEVAGCELNSKLGPNLPLT